jgi:hypothetical protein
MKGRSKLIVIFLLGLSVTLWPASAQDQPNHEVLTLQISAAPTESPTFEDTADGRIVFKVNPVGPVTGDLEGTFSHRVTQVEPASNEIAIGLLESTTAFFTIETEEGMIEGYYTGAFYFHEDTFPDATVRQRGQVLSVTAAYAELYLADVYYDAMVDFEEVDGSLIPLGDSGTMVIAPR